MSRCSFLIVVIAFFGISLLLWPIFALVSVIFGHLFSDGELLASLQYQPKRLLIADFFEGYRHSLPYTTIMAVLSILILLLHRNAVIRSVLVIAIPSVTVAIAFVIYLPFSLLGVFLIVKVLFLFLFFYAVCAYLLQRCGHV